MRQVNVHDCVQFFQRVYNSYYLYFLYFFLSIISYFLIYQGSAILVQNKKKKVEQVLSLWPEIK